ncbi:ATP-binding protein [Sphingobium rhizovicinum]|uniref:histidine kinase n=1 Tax=Sphingobium rhizovicinum TaxID=432308 RepID=A0ABV7NJJ9_9SPHN
MGTLIGFRGLFLVGAVTMALGLGALLGTIFHLQGSTRTFAQRADMAQRQALLLTRIDARAAQLALTRSSAARVELGDAVRAYLTSIADEEALMDGDEPDRHYQAQEHANAQRLVRLLMARPDDLTNIRVMIRHIAARENEEAELATAQARQAQTHAWRTILIILCLLLILPLWASLFLWRHLIRPLDALARASRSIACEAFRKPLPSSRLSEMQHLISQFDNMAQAVEEKVVARTGALQQLNQQLADTDQRRRLFLSKVSHELRTPVTVMRGEAEVALRMNGDAPSLRDALRQILDSNHFLERRLNDLLTLARAEDGALPIRHDPVDLAQLARQVGQSASGFANASGVRLELEALDRPMLAIGDADRLRQAMLALVDNGVKFSPPGGTIRLERSCANGQVGVLIKDEGPGVAEGELDRIFDPYVQGRAGRSLGGTGLGLSLARWIAQAHDGVISACNRNEGEGLCVSLRLPARV